jgi:hypothetical protein
MFARAQSGLPFTPLVQGDVNGDGRGGDRAFVPDAAREPDAATAAQLQALLASGAEGARACLTAYAGRVAARNGCRGPWTQTLNLQWRPPIPRRWASRLTTNVYLQNVLGASTSWCTATRPARLGLDGAPRPGAAGAARLRRAGAALPLRREPALRRHARQPHAAARAVPPLGRLLARPRGRVPGAAAAPRAGARCAPPPAPGRAARRTR